MVPIRALCILSGSSVQCARTNAGSRRGSLGLIEPDNEQGNERAQRRPEQDRPEY